MVVYIIYCIPEAVSADYVYTAGHVFACGSQGGYSLRACACKCSSFVLVYHKRCGY